MNKEFVRRNNKNAGYSLVEVTLALLVVAIGLTSTFALFPEAMKNTRTAVNDTEVALFADYIFSTLSVGAARYGANFRVSQINKFASLALSQDSDDMSKNDLDDSGSLANFYWIPENDSQGIQGDAEAWKMTKRANYWSTAFSYKLKFGKRNKGNNRDTIYATLEVWPGEWKSIADEKTFKPYVFYREILPYPNL